MPRKKKEQDKPAGQADTSAAPRSTVEATADSGQVAAPLPANETVDTTRQPEAVQPAQAAKPIRPGFVSSLAGVRAGEDRRFRNPQAYVAFDDDRRADDEEKAELRASGFKYRPTDKGYSALATPETRDAAVNLARKFAERRLKEKEEGQSR